MAFVLEVADLNSQAIEATLDDELFYIVLDWNETAKYWSMAIRNSSYAILIDGISLVPNYPLLWQFQYEFMPLGSLEVGTKQYTSGPIPRDGFLKGTYELVYWTKDDLLLDRLGLANVI